MFLEFNAWLYQGYDDAKTALLQVVAQKLDDELKKRKVIDTDALGKNLRALLRGLIGFRSLRWLFLNDEFDTW